MRLDSDRPSPFNPLAGNPMTRRADVATALRDCFEPLRPCFSSGGARVSIDATGTVYDCAASELEGFARPLWGMAAAAAGGVDDADWWPAYVLGLANGTDPAHPEYWGDIRPYDQRIVELAAIGVALSLSPSTLWDPLDQPTRRRLTGYLVQARSAPCFANNWKFFPLLIDLGLRAIGEAGDGAPVGASLVEIDQFHLRDGWYRDGDVPRIDHYSSFAFHFYHLILSRLSAPGSCDHSVVRERATAFAGQLVHWVAEDGAILPFGRSMTYRFACAAFFGACAFAGLEVLPWSTMKGIYLRHLRWWRQWPITRRDGLLSVGYGYPNARMAEGYNSAASPFWAFKAFLPLALPEDHPFWTAREERMPERTQDVVSLPGPGMLIVHEPEQSTALTGGQHHPDIHGGAEKYSKFAYSTRYAFSVEADNRFDRCTFDNMIALADADGDWRIRTTCDQVAIDADTIFTRWRPWPDVTVESWVYWDRPWHIRVHKIVSNRPLRTIEGGFCLPRPDGPGPFGMAEAGRAFCETIDDFSGIVDFSASSRNGRLHLTEPNTNLLYARAMVPQLIGQIASGEVMVGTAVIASPNKVEVKAAWQAPQFRSRQLRAP